MSAASVLLIDDDEESRAALRFNLEDFGHRVLAPDRRYTRVEELVEFAEESQVDITLCDHRLSPGNLAPFSGAEAVSALVRRHRVAVLMTGYIDIDFDTTIRTYRRHIPALLSREDLEEPDALGVVAAAVQREINGDVPAERRLWKTVARVADVSNEGSKPMLDVFIPGWRPAHAVRMPAETLPVELAADPRRLLGRFLHVEMNLGATTAEEIFFGQVFGLLEPTEWSVARVGTGADMPVRDDAPTGLFQERG